MNKSEELKKIKEEEIKKINQSVRALVELELSNYYYLIYKKYIIFINYINIYIIIIIN